MPLHGGKNGNGQKKGRVIPIKTHNLVTALIDTGRWSDSRIAQRTGVSKMYVTRERQRKKLGKVPFPSLNPWKVSALLRLMKSGKTAHAASVVAKIPHDTVERVFKYSRLHPEWVKNRNRRRSRPQL